MQTFPSLEGRGPNLGDVLPTPPPPASLCGPGAHVRLGGNPVFAKTGGPACNTFMGQKGLAKF